MAFCLIIIPILDMMKVMANEVRIKNTRHALTCEGAFFQNLKKLNLNNLVNRIKYTKFSMETITPKMPGASTNNGLNQNVNIFSGREYSAIFTPEVAELKFSDLLAANDRKSDIIFEELLRPTTASILSCKMKRHKIIIPAAKIFFLLEIKFFPKNNPYKDPTVIKRNICGLTANIIAEAITRPHLRWNGLPKE